MDIRCLQKFSGQYFHYLGPSLNESWQCIVLEMDMQVAETVSDAERLDHPIDCATLDGTCAHGWYRLHAGPLDVPRQERRRPDHDE